jgi:hypothetical protein
LISHSVFISNIVPYVSLRFEAIKGDGIPELATQEWYEHLEAEAE